MCHNNQKQCYLVQIILLQKIYSLLNWFAFLVTPQCKCMVYSLSLPRTIFRKANLQIVDLKFLGSMLDVNIDDAVKFRKASMPKSCICRNLFLTLVCNLQSRQFMSIFSDFLPPRCAWHLVKSWGPKTSGSRDNREIGSTPRCF